jgi:fatty acid kinase fatty acid binding subunit
MIAVCTDSTSQLPDELIERYSIGVVPITIVVDGVERREGADLGPDEFWSFFAGGAPEVTTSQPSPGQIAEVWKRQIEAGADEIVSIHVGREYSGTVNSARLAASLVDVPVHLVDTGSISFGVGCCAWRAAEVVADGGSAAAAIKAAEWVAPRLRNAFVMDGLELAMATGRMREAPALPAEGVPVYRVVGSDLLVLGAASDPAEAATLMIEAVLEDAPVMVGVGVAAAGAAPVGDAIAAALEGRADVKALVRYRVGASVGSATGPGTAGCFWFPAT